MSLAAMSHTPALPGLVVARDPAGLSLVRRADAAAAIWARSPLNEFQGWLDGLPPNLLPNGRVMLRPHAVCDMVTALCSQAGLPAGPNRDRLIGDIAALADIFSGLSGARFLSLRLEAVDTDACRKFHTDNIRLRMICTYRGPGTQYGLAAPGGEPPEVHDLPTGAVMVMRGRLWPARPDPGFVHRSPPIATTGQTRLVLVLDPVDDVDMDP